MATFSRRDFLRHATAGGAGLVLLSSCKLDSHDMPSAPAQGDPATPSTGDLSDPSDQADDAGANPAKDMGSADLAPTPTCEESQANIEGPYYRANAPVRSELGTAADGEVVILEGIVRGTAAACASLAGAELDIWQADAAAVYDATAAFRFRGRMLTDGTGRYQCQTILPGRYLNGNQYRPRHIHYKVRKAGFRPLTTQLYFQGDPYNASDPFIVASLVKPITKVNNVWRVTFDIVLAPA
jgi:catechol 1,2-dioxygenase